ncbi:Alpha-D-kanosaminyltransferase [Planctomycetes bacterium Pla86]|uniref:Alpha-D-kanosaminyltransferase n=2 Tax=Engelhardtia mirabilis TaxID=2528011 RepID=A0A518BN92_9BACT|nr:Alpha-D-kanosaminyltransferase [Planctomycetes bacterium Pla133]QDV02777.1 Alpha-D-kanosaminyltransferase [Planctomycetes bacterium Pla86]
MGAEPGLTVVHVDAERGFSGGEVQVLLLAEALAERGYTQVIACATGGELARVAAERDFRVAQVTMRSDLSLLAVGALSRLFSEVDADIVHLHTGRATWLGGLAARRAGRPAITTRRMDRTVKRSWRNRLIYGALVDRAVGISTAVSGLLTAGGVPRAKIETVWDAVDPARVVPRRPPGEVRAALETDPGAVVVTFCGALVRRKGVDVLLRAAALLRRSEPRLVLWIAGDGPDRPALEALAEQLGIAERVRFLGRVDGVGDLLGASDFGVLPSRAEGVGVAALETMAAGRPIVASAVGGLAEVVVDGETGSLVPPDDVDALASALGKMARDSWQRDRMGQAGRDRVAERYLPEHMVEAYDRIYRDVLRARG